MAVSNVIAKVSESVNKVCTVLSVGMLGAMVLVTFVQIICRVFFTALSWSEELARYLLVWSTFIGAGCVYKTSGHISVEVVQNLLPRTARTATRIFVHILCGILFAIAVVYGIKYMSMVGTQKSAALHIPMKYMYAAIPVGCGIMIVHAIALITNILGEKEGEKV
ncbi:MAG: TRAP transporter small permease [Lachnospiraceae bacterium]|nr:TRAP transporter small permease [Lachnospiraceae bacterium]